MLRVRRGSAPTFLTGWWFVRTTNGRAVMTADIKDSDLHWLHSVWTRVWGQPARTEGVTVNAETLPVLMSQSRRGDFDAQIFLGVNTITLQSARLSASATVINHDWISGFLYHSPILLSEHDPFFLFSVRRCSSLFVLCPLPNLLPLFPFGAGVHQNLSKELITVTYQSKALTKVLKFWQDLPQSQPAPAKTRL